MSVDEDLQILEHQVTQLKRDYEQYFLGSRPREPGQLRASVQKQILRYTNQPIQNTAARFRFNSINSRYQAFKRQWDSILRQIEAGTYKRHVFKANLRDRERQRSGQRSTGATPVRTRDDGDLFEHYRDAALACGQSVEGLTRDKLQAVVKRQEASLREKLGCERVRFRVVVEAGKVKLKASAER